MNKTVPIDHISAKLIWKGVKWSGIDEYIVIVYDGI